MGGLLLATVLGLPGCGESQARPVTASRTAVAKGPMATQSTHADPCHWVTVTEVSSAVGRRVRGTPTRVASAESVTPSSTGAGCMYELEPKAGREPAMITVEVKIDGGEMQAGLGAASIRELHTAQVKATGNWEWVGGLPAGLFAARQGHVGVMVAISDLSLAPSDVEPLAAQIIARVPDLPFANEPGDPAVAGTGHDPCSLIARAEAEAVLGLLTVAPFRSQTSSPVAHGNGESCTYYSAHHKVVVLTPTWSDGKLAFGALRMAGGLTRTVSGAAEAANAIGPWDERSRGPTGSSLFLKGDRMLELNATASGADEAAVLALARVALGRL